MKTRIATALAATVTSLAIVFAACAQTDGTYVPPDFPKSGNEQFDIWRKDFASRAVNIHKKDRAIIETMLSNAQPSQTVVNLNNSQPELIKPVWQYIDNAVSTQRIATGIEKLGQYKFVLGKKSDELGVPLEFSIAIWAMESGFGANKGNIDVINALSTLAYDGRRKELGESELLSVHDILKNQFATKEKLIGSWAGAMGHTQFMPSSYLARAIDGDNDGVRDIWDNPIDALASTLNYLNSVGWKRGEPWGKQVELSPKFDWSLMDGQMRPLSFWRQNGMISPFADVSPEWQARLLVPAGANGPKFLVGANYGAIRHYNASDSYALSVAFLADAFAGGQIYKAVWPVNDPPITRSETKELQYFLNSLGLLEGAPDGAAGAKTKAALQKFQLQKGLIADGYPNAKALSDLRTHFGIAPPAPPKPKVEELAPIPQPVVFPKN